MVCEAMLLQFTEQVYPAIHTAQCTVWTEQGPVRHASMTTTTLAMRSVTINEVTHLN